MSDEKVSVGNPIMVSGWGWTLHMDWDSIADTMQQLMMPVVEPDVCDPQFEDQPAPWHRVKPHEICAGFAGEVYINICHGDSGSPAVSRANWKQPFKQVGVVSWATGGCPEDAHYAVFASVHSFYDWIQEVVNTYNPNAEEGSGEVDYSGDDSGDYSGIY